MVDIATNSYQGKDRRNGNGRLKLSTGEWIKIIIISGGIIASFVTVQITSGNNSTRLDRVEGCPAKVAVLENDIGAIKEDVGDLKDNVKEIQTEQKVLRKEMNDNFKELLKAINEQARPQ